MASLKFLLVVIVCLVPSAFCSFWTPCATGRPPISVTSPSCINDRCNAIRGENIRLTTVSEFIDAHPALRPRAFVVFGGITIQIPDDPNFADVCRLMTYNGAFHGCPTVPNRRLEWTLDMLIPTSIPAFNNGRIRVQLLDAGNIVQCFEVLGSMS